MLRKRVNINLILALILVAGLLVIPIALGTIVNSMSDGMEEIRTAMDGAFEDGEIDTVEEHGLIFEGAIYGLGTLASTMLVVVIFVVSGYAGLLLAFAVLARLVFAKEGGRLLVYRVLMGVEYLLQVILVVFLTISLLDYFKIIYLVITLLITAGLIYSAGNTYTKRICE